MKDQVTTKTTIKSYGDEIRSILDAYTNDQTKLRRISKVGLPETNANALLIKRLAERALANKSISRQPMAGEVVEIFSRDAISQIKQVLEDTSDANFYTFAYQLDAHYSRQEDGVVELRKLTRYIDTDDLPTKAEARKLATEWAGNIEHSFREKDSEAPFRLDNVVAYCVTLGGFGPWVDYDQYVTKEQAGILSPGRKLIET